MEGRILENLDFKPAKTEEWTAQKQSTFILSKSIICIIFFLLLSEAHDIGVFDW